MKRPDSTDSAARNAAFEARAAALRDRVAAAARALSERGIQPTVARIRAALGGGSPNDLAPALKSWRETASSDVVEVSARGTAGAGRIPSPIADLAHELWQRAFAAASLELQHGPAARRVTVRTAEADALRTQLSALRQQLERESLAYGELRAQAARHETIARQALTRARDAETRAHDLLRELGEALQKVAQLAAELQQRRRPAQSLKGRESASQNRRAASTSKRVKRTSRPRAASSVAQKGSAHQSKKKTKKATGKRRQVPGGQD